VSGIPFGLSFVVVILRSNKANGQSGRKTYILLGCERGGKYRKYKFDLKPSITGTWKCDCSSNLCGKQVRMEEGWQLKVKCGTHNHDLSKTLVSHPYAGRLKMYEQFVLVDMTKCLLKPSNILLSLKENNEDNVTTIKQLYNAMYAVADLR